MLALKNKAIAEAFDLYKEKRKRIFRRRGLVISESCKSRIDDARNESKAKNRDG